MQIICGIYKITNKITGQFYIGQSKNIKRRWYQHRTNYKTQQHCLYSDMRSFGIENFELSIVEECEEEQLRHKEQY